MTKPRHFLIDDDLDPVEVVAILDHAERLKFLRVQVPEKWNGFERHHVANLGQKASA